MHASTRRRCESQQQTGQGAAGHEQADEHQTAHRGLGWRIEPHVDAVSRSRLIMSALLQVGAGIIQLGQLSPQGLL